jgi:hypothetical protein
MRGARLPSIPRFCNLPSSRREFAGFMPFGSKRKGRVFRFFDFLRETSAYLSMQLGEKVLNGLMENALGFFLGFFEESLDAGRPLMIRPPCGTFAFSSCCIHTPVLSGRLKIF